MPLQATSGAASQDAFGGNGVAVVPNYIEDVFSTFLYTGTGATQTITNNIDLSTKGGLTWIKGRSGATGHRLTDTARGVTKSLESNSTAAEVTESTGLTAFGTTGFTIGADADYNTSAATYASWTFRKQPNFFDVQTFTGNGTAKTISHNLGSAPACIFVKRLNSATGGEWYVFHRSLASPHNKYLWLNSSDAVANYDNLWGPNGYLPTATEFKVGEPNNLSGATYVAYLFAHDAGGFGLTGTDNVISCGSFTPDGSGNATINLGFEPQWLLMKNSTSSNDWFLFDTMRSFSLTSQRFLFANRTDSEGNFSNLFAPTATGFTVNAVWANLPTIYIAIRRGPMKVPTTGTSVYNAIARTGTGAVAQITGVGFPPDFVHSQERGGNAFSSLFDKLRGTGKHLYTQATTAELTRTTTLTSFNMDGITVGADADNNIINFTSLTYINNFFRRAPSFMDVVCFTGTGSATTFSHNLQAVPELMLVRRRSTGNDWAVYANNDNTDYLVLNTTAATADDNTYWNDTSPTSSVFSVGTNNAVNASASTYVAYLFATCSGVSKVGSYTGTGTTKQIDCGFTAGARFVLIKRTDSTGDWYFWDSTRGIVAGNDPYLLLNNLAAEVTNTDYIDTYSAGFEISSTAPAAINANGGTYIFLAIA